MKLVFSYALVLHRVFDSAAPGGEPVFRGDGRILRPCRKGEGLYVFVDEAAQTVEILCPGYQQETVQPQRGEALHVGLYPDGSLPPPPGWKVTLGRAPPGTLVFWADAACDVRLLEHSSAGPLAMVRLRAVPGFLGGCLRFIGDDFSRVALIWGKEPPDKYCLSGAGGDLAGCRVEKGYAARAGPDETVAVLSPVDFPVPLCWQKGGV